MNRRLKSALILTLLYIAIAEGASAIGLSLLGFPVYYPLEGAEEANYRNPKWTEKEPWGAWGEPNTISRLRQKCFDVEYRFNSFGARDRERSPQGKNRWIVLGDSFVDGYGIEAQDRITDRLEKGLGREFMNFGMSGNLGPLQYLLLYRDISKRFEHDGVIVGFLPSNDFTDNDEKSWLRDYGPKNARRYRPYLIRNSDNQSYRIEYGIDGLGVPRHDFNVPPPLPPNYAEPPAKNTDAAINSTASLHWIQRFLSNHSATFSLLRQLWVVAKGKSVEKIVHPNADWTTDNTYFIKNKRLVDNTLLAMRDLAQAAGDKKKIVFLFPSEYDLSERRRTHEKYSTELKNFVEKLQQLGWTVIDTAAAFDEAKFYKDTTLGCDPHWNAKSNGVVADYLITHYRALF